MLEPRQPTEADLSADAMHQIREAMQSAVRTGIREALTDKEVLALFWDSAFETMQSRATKETGRFVISGIRGAASKAFWLFILGAIAFQFGGWAAVTSAWKAITATGAH